MSQLLHSWYRSQPEKESQSFKQNLILSHQAFLWLEFLPYPTVAFYSGFCWIVQKGFQFTLSFYYPTPYVIQPVTMEMKFMQNAYFFQVIFFFPPFITHSPIIPVPFSPPLLLPSLSLLPLPPLPLLLLLLTQSLLFYIVLNFGTSSCCLPKFWDFRSAPPCQTLKWIGSLNSFPFAWSSWLLSLRCVESDLNSPRGGLFLCVPGLPPFPRMASVLTQ